MVVAVVEGDQRGLAAEPAGLEEPDVRFGDDLFLEVGKVERRRVHYLAPLKFGFSQMTVPPWPRPTHMVVMP